MYIIECRIAPYYYVMLQLVLRAATAKCNKCDIFVTAKR